MLSTKTFDKISQIADYLRDHFNDADFTIAFSAIKNSTDDQQLKDALIDIIEKSLSTENTIQPLLTPDDYYEMFLSGNSWEEVKTALIASITAEAERRQIII